MNHQLIQLTKRVFDTPQLISYGQMVMIADYLNMRNTTGSKTFSYIEPPERKPIPMEDDSEEDVDDDNSTYYPEFKVGIIPITGILTAVPFYGMCGEEGTSYVSLQNSFQAMIDVGAKTVVLDTDSCGGEAAGCFETAAYVKQLAQENDIKLITYVDGVAFSAAYAWASIADEVIMNPTSEVGSIGVVVQLTNYNKMYKEAGIETTYIFAGKQKIPFDANGDWQETFLADIQDKVDLFYQDFTEFTALNRSVPVQAIKDTEARTFLHKDAIKLGLADKVMTKADFTSYIFNRDE